MLTESRAVAVLEVRGVTKKIGGLVAVNGVDLTVGRDEIVGLVGPNGAGKTTLLNIISGITPPTSGTVRFLNEDITGMKPEQVCRRGITKTFQIVQLFPDMTARQCVMIGALFGNRDSLSMAGAAAEGGRLLDFVHLPEDKWDKLVKNLNVVELKRVELARALASRPTLLLLDELMTGLNPMESQDAIGLIKEIHNSGVSILIIEHVMRVIMELSDRIVVLDHGEKIADGRPRDVVNDQRVIDSYLGELDIF